MSGSYSPKSGSVNERGWGVGEEESSKSSTARVLLIPWECSFILHCVTQNFIKRTFPPFYVLVFLVAHVAGELPEPRKFSPLLPSPTSLAKF